MNNLYMYYIVELVLKWHLNYFKVFAAIADWLLLNIYTHRFLYLSFKQANCRHFVILIFSIFYTIDGRRAWKIQKTVWNMWFLVYCFLTFPPFLLFSFLEDKNECEKAGVCAADQTCMNSEGSYRCQCTEINYVVINGKCEGLWDIYWI